MSHRFPVLFALCSLAVWSQPVAEWSFEGAAPETHPLQIRGVERVPGAIGQGLRFAGADSSAQGMLADDLQCPAAVTVEAWVRPEGDFAKQEGPGIVSAGNYLLRITRGTPSFHVFTTGWRPVLAASPARPGVWLYLAGTYDGAEMRIYVNGRLSGTQARTGAIPASTSAFVLGRQANPFVGIIDEVRITRSCLKEGEIAARFGADCGRLNDGIVPGQRPESEANIPEPPPELARIGGARLVRRPAAEVGASVLAVRATIPKTSATFWVAEDPSWRAAERIGATALQIWPPPGPKEDWEDLSRALGPGRPHGVRIAVPVSGQPQALAAAWARLAAHADAIDAILVGTGLPTNPSSPLASWRHASKPDEWVASCVQARRLAPGETMVVLARLPLLGKGADEQLAATAQALKGTADGICVWLATEDAPEAVEPAICHAIVAAKANGLVLWLDADCWRDAAETLRNARFLRLLALCQTLDVRLTWWPELLDENLDPIPLFYAAQAWQSVANPGTGTAETVGTARVLRWRDAAGASYVAWWRPDAEVGTIDSIGLELPAGATIIDPLHARFLKPEGKLPLCSWPLLARGK